MPLKVGAKLQPPTPLFRKLDPSIVAEEEDRLASDDARQELTRQGDPPPLPEPLRVDTVDSHCHLDAMDVDVAHAVAAARSVGITRLITVGDSSSRHSGALTLPRRTAMFGPLSRSIPITPTRPTMLHWRAIDRLASLPQVRAVGETGLDYYWGRVEPMVQAASFRAHIAIAKAHGKALVIHDRDAHDDVLRILDDEGAPDRTVFHCFSGDADFARVAHGAATACRSPGP